VCRQSPKQASTQAIEHTQGVAYRYAYRACAYLQMAQIFASTFFILRSMLSTRAAKAKQTWQRLPSNHAMLSCSSSSSSSSSDTICLSTNNTFKLCLGTGSALMGRVQNAQGACNEGTYACWKPACHRRMHGCACRKRSQPRPHQYCKSSRATHEPAWADR